MELSHSYIAAYVKRAQNGDSDAFAELYNLTYKKVYNYARYYLKDEYLAQDAVQEIYINALKNIQKLNDPTLFVAWINQISFHVCYDMTKSRKSDYGEVDSEILEEICDAGPDSNPEDTAVSRDESERLKKAIDRLPDTDKQIVILRFFNDMKIDDIVDATGLSRSTVKRRLQDVTEKLRKLMKE